MFDELINTAFDEFEDVISEVLGAYTLDPELIDEGISFLTDDFVLDGMLLGLF